MEIQALNMTVVWLVILVALVVIELLTMGLTTVWFAGRACGFAGVLTASAGYFTDDTVSCCLGAALVFYKTDCGKIF